MPDLPQIGFYAEVQNSAGFQRAAAAVDSAILRVSNTVKSATDKVNISLRGMDDKFKQAFDKVVKTVQRAGDGVKKALQTIEKAIKNVALLIAGLLTGALAILSAGFIGFIGLMQRGAGFQGIINSFERLTGSINVSASALLDGLRRAALDTIPDMELLRMTNVALAGATGEFATQFAEQLPNILAIAGAQARATGQDVDYLFQSLITGIKRGSPMLIDNTGLVLRLEEANKNYAESIGITVEQMTAEQKQLALLNAVAEAGAQAMETLGDAQMTNAMRIAQIGTFITNIFDRIAILLEPIFAQILGTVSYFLRGVQNFLGNASIYIAAIVQQIAATLSQVFGSIEGWADEMSSPTAARAFFMGAANTFGSFLRGVIQVATQIMQVISDLAAGIASFLLGSSPPPEGPLSQMDKGARATMNAYLQGLAGVSLQPVEQVAARINRIIGNIDNLNSDRLALRFAALDQALEPFVTQLALAEAHYNALALRQNAALDNVNEELDAAVMALVNGDAGAAELVRTLDAQRTGIERNLAAEERRVDAARLQLELAEAEQAVTRARLEARQRELAIQERIARARENLRPERPEPGVTPTEEEESDGGGGGGAGPKEPAGGGGGELPLPEAVGGGGGPAQAFENLFEFDEKEIGAAGEQISKAFMEGLGGGTLEAFGETRTAMESNVSSLGAAFDALPTRIAQIGTQISNAIQVNVVNPVEIWFARAASHFDSTQFGTFAYYVATLGTRIGMWLSQVGANITRVGAQIGNAFQVAIVNPIEIAVRNLAMNFDSAVYGSFAYTLATLGTRISSWFATIGATFTTVFVDPIKLVIDTGVKTLFGGVDEPLSIAYKINEFITGLPTTLAQLGSTLQTALVAPFLEKVTAIKDWLVFFFTAQNEVGSLDWILDTAVDFFFELPNRISEALSSIGSMIITTFVVPIINAINTVIEAFESLINEMITPIADLMGALGQAAVAVPGMGTAAAGLIQGAESLRGQQVSLGRIPVPGAATGGTFGPGLLRVGEQGEELIANAARRVSIFPNSVLTALEGLRAVPQALPASGLGGGNIYNNSSESNANYNFNNLNNDSQVLQRIALLRSIG